jgi:hypothetical protein
VNEAQKLLVAIGGTAELVAGHMEHYWADSQTAKKEKQRKGRIGGGKYGRNLMAYFDRVKPGATQVKAKRDPLRKAA